MSLKSLIGLTSFLDLRLKFLEMGNVDNTLVQKL